MRVLGLDVGGANIKALLLEVLEGKIRKLETLRFYWPLWKLGKNSVVEGIKRVKQQLGDTEGIVLTTTAEVCDIFESKREGIKEVISSVKEVYPETKIRTVTVNGKLVDENHASNKPLEIASANWYATGYLASKFFENCLVIDIGSTTTSIIPVIDGKVQAVGKTDVEKLSVGELVYTGLLRTNISFIAQRVPIRGYWTSVSPELFALTADVYLVLNQIKEEEYTTETADNRGRSRSECLARLARVVCADSNMLSEDELELLARFIRFKQINMIAEALWQVCSRFPSKFKQLRAIVTGIGKDILARRACEIIGIKEIFDLDSLVGYPVSPVAPCLGLCVMFLDELGVRVKWK